MGYQRAVKLFRNGRNQAVRIPREFELPGDDAVMRKEGDRLIIEARPGKETLSQVLARHAKLPPLETAMPEIDDLPAEPVEL